MPDDDYWKTMTIDNHLLRHTPYPIDDDAARFSHYGRQWEWPYYKFDGYQPEDLFTTLHEEFNTLKCAIQDPYAWHSDVNEIAQITWKRVAISLIANPDQWDEPPDRRDQWAHFVRVSRHFSYDTLVTFFGAYHKEEKIDSLVPNSAPAETRPATRKGSRGNTKQKSPTPSGVNKRPSCSSTSIPKKSMPQTDNRKGVRRSTRLQQRIKHSKQ
ncbi:hypothetical protein N7456_008119 [Penicillium angulare]|uniref:Uncharacterized protein n=1 Tax=Penicillium angulare TaxID=116970 RepID=A0A9W9FBX3_9EURO|nr:hypothetical protein N7456_008119 [Penicillium angulare]